MTRILRHGHEAEIQVQLHVAGKERRAGERTLIAYGADGSDRYFDVPDPEREICMSLRVENECGRCREETLRVGSMQQEL